MTVPVIRTSEVIVPPAKDLGPAMLALTERQQRFVIAYMGVGMQKGYARAAGIAAGFKEGPGLNVTVSRLLRDKKIIAAISEELVHYDAALGWRGRARMAELAESGDEDVAFKASKALLEMTGNFVKRSEVKVMHELEALSTEELERRIAEAEARVLAQREAERLRLTPPLDAEFTVIESGGPSHR